MYGNVKKSLVERPRICILVVLWQYEIHTMNDIRGPSQTDCARVSTNPIPRRGRSPRSFSPHTGQAFSISKNPKPDKLISLGLRLRMSFINVLLAFGLC